MQKEVWEIIGHIYENALTLKTEEQDVFVKKKSKGNKEVYQQVINMLKFDDNDNFMSGIPAVITIEALEKQHDLVKIGHFKVIEKIASGGMGVVYKAQSTLSDVQIIVALKTIRIELKNTDMEARFFNEKIILAKLKHKNIASLIDAGVDDNGIPYIATEWIDGENIISYCDKHKLGLKPRLVLFQQLCDALNYAHNQLVIHRDIKPNNILVDKNQQVKLLDFGIAKLVADDDLSATQTQIFTPEYAAPEQINGQRCTVVTDVYAMGVLLFEMLTAEKRFNLAELSLPQRIQSICKPTVINASNAINKEQHPIRANSLRGALNTIINKAMHVDKNRRYETVGLLLADIKRYLSNLPIKAIKDSWFYRLQMFIKRNSLVSLLTSLLFISLTVGLIYSLQQTKLARQEALKSQQLYQFYKNSYKSAAPVEGGDTTISVRKMFINGAKNFDLEKVEDLYVRAQIAGDIGLVMSEFQAYDLEKMFLTKALEFYLANIDKFPTQYLNLSIRLSRIEDFIGNKENALTLISSAYDKSQVYKVSADVRAEALINMGQYNKTLNNPKIALNFYNKAEGFANQVNDYESIAKVNYYKFILLQESHDVDILEQMLLKAQINFKKAYKFDTHPDLLSVKNSQALWYTSLGDYNKANQLFREIGGSHQSIYGFIDYSKVINHANVYYYLGDFKQVIKLTTKALARMNELKIKVGFTHIAAIIIQARALTELRQYLQAESLYQQAYDYFNEIVPKTHNAMITLNSYRMNHYLKAGDLVKATKLSQKMDEIAYNQLNQTAGTKNRYVNILVTIANLKSTLNQPQQALDFYLKANKVIQTNTKKQGWIYWVIQLGIEKSHYELKSGYNKKRYKQAYNNLFAVLQADNWFHQFFNLTYESEQR